MSTPTLRPDGRFAVYQGHEYYRSSWRPNVVILHDYGRTPPERFVANQGHWQLVVPPKDLDRIFLRDATCWWRGAHFTIDKVEDDIVEGGFLMDGWPVPRAEMLQWPQISQSPWDRAFLIGQLPISEIYDVTIREYDIDKDTGLLTEPADPRTFPQRFYRPEYFTTDHSS
ncbi:hypothetical protein [Nocardia otitidiscaviarum]|uniref:hypothetical protein n=1 Tax=Nocardia otitidiscaviarum TaxID=1823 RepID=UPI002458A255|nr:hypothetical protein [Nocardia otitidiscaviarum]